jgi:hypothetical protein
MVNMAVATMPRYRKTNGIKSKSGIDRMLLVIKIPEQTTEIKMFRVHLLLQGNRNRNSSNNVCAHEITA